MRGDKQNYDFSAKRHWRRWAWNRIAERLTVPPREALVAYLPGPEDEDRPIALSKGFRADNLIAVDRALANVEAVRGEGNLAICGDAYDVIGVMLHKRRIDVIFLDLCCGYSFKLMNGLASLLTSQNLAGSTVAVNLMRGRDAGVSKLNTNLIELGHESLSDDERHRGRLFFGASIPWAYNFVNEQRKRGNLPNLPDVRIIMKSVSPVFSSYRSVVSNCYFDSVVFCAPREFALEAVYPTEDERWAVEKAREEIEELKPLQRRIAATMAHRTMRLSTLKEEV